jgi:hypothetical protein
MCITYCLRHGSWRFIRSISFVNLKCITLHIVAPAKRIQLGIPFRHGSFIYSFDLKLSFQGPEHLELGDDTCQSDVRM